MAIIEQYVYFAFYSDTTHPSEVTERLGIQPTEISIAGSRRPDPRSVPVSHSWKFRSGSSDKEPLDRQFSELLRVLVPKQAEIEALLSGGAFTAGLQVVRYIKPGAEDPNVLEEHEQDGLERLRGQHPLVGFCMEKEMIKFLAGVGVEVDFDEYCDEYE